MKSYDPGFQDRGASRAEAKEKALNRLRAKPPLDEAVVAERQAAALRREAAEAEKRAARQAAKARADAEKAERAAAAAAAVVKPPTEAERKAARDARYAARQARK